MAPTALGAFSPRAPRRLPKGDSREVAVLLKSYSIRGIGGGGCPATAWPFDTRGDRLNGLPSAPYSTGKTPGETPLGDRRGGGCGSKGGVAGRSATESMDILEGGDSLNFQHFLDVVHTTGKIDKLDQEDVAEAQAAFRRSAEEGSAEASRRSASGVSQAADLEFDLPAPPLDTQSV